MMFDHSLSLIDCDCDAIVIAFISSISESHLHRYQPFLIVPREFDHDDLFYDYTTVHGKALYNRHDTNDKTPTIYNIETMLKYIHHPPAVFNDDGRHRKVSPNTGELHQSHGGALTSIHIDDHSDDKMRVERREHCDNSASDGSGGGSDRSGNYSKKRACVDESDRVDVNLKRANKSSSSSSLSSTATDVSPTSNTNNNNYSADDRCRGSNYSNKRAHDRRRARRRNNINNNNTQQQQLQQSTFLPDYILQRTQSQKRTPYANRPQPQSFPSSLYYPPPHLLQQLHCAPSQQQFCIPITSLVSMPASPSLR
jgi:hypothetical protein